MMMLPTYYNYTTARCGETLPNVFLAVDDLGGGPTVFTIVAGYNAITNE
jgi:hypothetical protein